MLQRQFLLLSNFGRSRLSVTCQVCKRSFSQFDHSLKEPCNDKEVSFGYERVADSNEKQRRVNDVFSSVAKNYDVMNDVMSAGIHRFWKDEFVRQCNVQKGMKVLDMAGGTGDIAFRIQRSCPTASITVGDINQDMLNVGIERSQSNNKEANEITWTLADGQNLPFDDNTFDLYTVSFGIRNYGDINQGLKEALRVLKPGGRFMCLEFSNVDNDVLRNLYDQYSQQLIPVFGALIASDWGSYQYLVESIRKFPGKEEFGHIIETNGFKAVTFNTFLNGIAAIHSAFKL